MLFFDLSDHFYSCSDWYNQLSLKPQTGSKHQHREIYTLCPRYDL